MPSISLHVNGVRIATIDLARMQVVAVSVNGALDREKKAMLGAMGGNYADGGSGFLIWIDDHVLLPGDLLSISFDEHCDISDQGKTMEELCPDEAPGTRSDFTINDAMAAEIRARPRLHDTFVVQAHTSSSQPMRATSDEFNTGFSFRVVWDDTRPHEARVRLATHCLDDVLARTGGNDHLNTTLLLAQSASFVLVQ